MTHPGINVPGGDSARVTDQFKARRSRFRRNSNLLSVAMALAGISLSSYSFAFKPKSHALVAVEALEELQNTINDPSGSKLVFTINGKRFEVPVSATEVYEAVQANQSYFLAGAMGPDAFADLITGQMLAHADEALAYKGLVYDANGNTRLPPHHDIWEKFESRQGIAEYRAVDYAMDMVKFLGTYTTTDPAERQQILAFIAGYFGHAVTDGFSHTWVNDFSKEAWSLSHGSGILGEYTEEIQHVAVETLTDSKIPVERLSTPGDGGGMGKVKLAVPTKFLDAYYASPTALGSSISADIRNSPSDYIRLFRNIDLYRGGIVYTYFNAQVELPMSLRGWSRMGWLFTLAEKVRNNEAVDFILSAMEVPEKIMNELQSYANQVIPSISIPDPIALATFGWADCHQGGSTGPLPTENFTEELRVALDYLGGMDDRLEAHQKRALVARLNYERLSACTMENIAKAHAAAYDATQPTLNTDACADIVRAGWKDEGNVNGLDRGGVGDSTAVDREFLANLKAAFLGGDADELFAGEAEPWAGDAAYDASKAYEANNDHRSTKKNVERIVKYLAKVGATAGDITEAILPSDGGSTGGGSIASDKLNKVCSDARSSALENCISLAAFPVVLGVREIGCGVEWAKCTAEATKNCLGKVCNSTCGAPLSQSQCNDMCGEPGSCVSTCDSLFCWDSPLGKICEPATYLTCTLAICEIIGGSDDSCAATAVDELHCTAKSVYCSAENLYSSVDELLSGHSVGETVLAPVRKACDYIDAAKEFFECLKGDETLSAEDQQAQRRSCIIDACSEIKDTAGSAAPDEVKNLDCTKTFDDIAKAYDDAQKAAKWLGNTMAMAEKYPVQFVNVMFVQEDAAADPGYRTAMKNELVDRRSNLLASPPPAGATPDKVALYDCEISVLDAAIAAVDGATPPPPCGGNPLQAADALAEVMNGPWPEPLGGTARKILGDIGPSFSRTFVAAFNAIQGTKLAPMQSKDDITAMFEQQGVDTNLLPWNAPTYYSEFCTGSQTSIYCDAVPSFDDPNCKGPDCPATYLNPMSARNNWVPGRGVVAFNPYSPNNPVRNVLTNFPLASSQAAYELLYKKIFLIPQGLPSFAGFEDLDSPWTSNQATLREVSESTAGAASTGVHGCNWVSVDSPFFSTAEFGVVGSKLLIDVKLPTPTNQNSAGDLQAAVSIPGANVYNSYLNNGNPISFTGMTAGWHTIELSVPTNVRQALLGDYANARISIIMNMATCGQPILLDNLRFGGDLVDRETFHVRASDMYRVTSSPVLSFDNQVDWSANVDLSVAPEHIQGAAALAVAAGGWTPVVSRRFALSEIAEPSKRINVDVYVPTPQPNMYWFGDMQVFWECDHLSYRSLGWAPFTHRFDGEFNSFQFDVPNELWTLLATPGSEQCRVTVALNVNPSGSFYLDNMGFIH